MTEPNLRDRFADVQERLQKACDAAGRKREDVTLIAVSKLQPAAAVAAVAGLGQVDFGENYVQEALEKRQDALLVGANIRWHLIGHIQSRKAPLVAGAFSLIHSVDSLKLGTALERRLDGSPARPVLIEVNVAAEAQKSGVMADALPELADYICESCPHLVLRGLMCLPPVFDAGEAARPYFALLYRLREELRAHTGLALPELSMGMSGDFEVAVAEGATLVRIGTDIFGPRPPRV